MAFIRSVLRAACFVLQLDRPAWGGHLGQRRRTVDLPEREATDLALPLQAACLTAPVAAAAALPVANLLRQAPAAEVLPALRPSGLRSPHSPRKVAHLSGEHPCQRRPRRLASILYGVGPLGAAHCSLSEPLALLAEDVTQLPISNDAHEQVKRRSRRF